MVEVINKKNCVGCNACVQICPKHCIKPYEDKEGFLYPKVDVKKCIQCNLCHKVCPMLHIKTGTSQFSICYAAKSKNETLRLRSSSGGIFPIFAKVIIDQVGIVYGARFTSDWRVVHCGISTKDEVSLLMGAKYIQSNTKETYHEVEENLKAGNIVLYSGTPCQIAGLKVFLKKDYNNLYAIEVICHGVPSYKVFREYLKSIFCENNKIQSISFRDKKFGWINYSLSLRKKSLFDEEVRYIPNKDNVFMKYFIDDLYLRPSCYSCPFKKSRSGADITLGDFWGIQDVLPDFYDEKGVSAIIVNTLKGEYLFQLIKEDILYHKVDYSDILRKNKSLEESAEKHPWRDYFFKRLEQDSFVEILNKIQHPSILMRVVRKIKTFI